jgi:uncharacterized protein YfiM (DUF2279 family)
VVSSGSSFAVIDSWSANQRRNKFIAFAGTYVVGVLNSAATAGGQSGILSTV